MSRIIGCLFIFAQLAAGLPAAEPSPIAPDPETVHVTYHLAPGKEAEFLQAVKTQWRILREMRLVTGAPHLLVRGKEASGGVYYVEVFTWVSAGIPDHAPAKVQAVWGEMNKFCPAHDGRTGIEIDEVERVDAGG